MRIEIDVTMQYQLGDDTRVLLAVEAAQTAGQTILSEDMQIACAQIQRIDGEGGLGQRLWAEVGGDQLDLRYRAVVDVTRPVQPLEGMAATPLHQLPGEAMSCLRPSRFCQSDLFTSFVDQRFGDLEGGTKIAAIRDWVGQEMSYVPASSFADTTVLDTFASRQGVCRDYAHMVVALARAAAIPARYVSVYGVDVDPPDFHAVAQVWLDGEWHLVDATGMCQPDGIVVIGAGRDACDVPFMETRAPAQLVEQAVRVMRL